MSVEKGDVVIVPAGIGHRLLEDFGSGFSMVGGYPEGCSWDMCYGESGEEDRMEKVKGVEWFRKDPMYGEDGPVLWGQELEGRTGGGKNEL